MSKTMKTMACWLTLVLVGALLLPADALAGKTVLRLRLDGPVMEAPSQAAGLMALLAEEEAHTLRDWTNEIGQAAADSKVDGIVLIIEQPRFSFAQLEELTRALKAFRATGKPVHCYVDHASNLSYALAAASDHITLAEHSELAIIGLRGQMTFFKGLLDKIGVEADMMHCGAYKSALEPFTRTEPSPEAAENVNWLMDGLYEQWLKLIADGRGLPVEEVRKLVDEAPLSSEKALSAKLIDEVSSFPAFKQRIRKEFGKDVKVLKKYKERAGIEIDPNNPFAFFQIISEMMKGPPVASGPGIGLIYIDGAITTGKSDDSPLGGSSAGSTTLRSAFEQARENDDVRAVVLRVDSPGGSALASDIIWEAATRCAAEKPLIVSMGGVAGSGGYYVAIPGDTIFAEATTLTGSIGVVGGKLVWRELMEGTLGITTTEFVRGKHADLMSMSRKWNDSERQWITGYINEVYEQFKGRVMSSRGERLKKDLEDIAGGRVFTGAQAKELGLVDEIGGLADAMKLAAEKAGLGADYEVYPLPKPDEFAAFLDFFQGLVGREGDDEFEISVGTRVRRDPLLRAALPLIGELAPAQLQELTRALRDLVILRKERVGCFMPFVPRIN